MLRRKWVTTRDAAVSGCCDQYVKRIESKLCEWEPNNSGRNGEVDSFILQQQQKQGLAQTKIWNQKINDKSSLNYLEHSGSQ